MSDCRFGVSPVNYPDPDPDHDLNGSRMFKNPNWPCQLSGRASAGSGYHFDLS